jgi:hypothetical protein
MNAPPSASPFTIAWITASFPPEVTGVSLGNLERARWFAAQDDVRMLGLGRRFREATAEAALALRGALAG